MTPTEARAIYQQALAHPEPIDTSGRLLVGLGWALLLVSPFWIGAYWLVVWLRSLLP